MGEEEEPVGGHFEYSVSIWSRLVFFQRVTSNDLKIKQMFWAEPNIWKKLSGMMFGVVMKVGFVPQLPHEHFNVNY